MRTFAFPLSWVSSRANTGLTYSKTKRTRAHSNLVSPLPCSLRCVCAQLPSATSIKRFLKSRLPPYAVPHVCILLDAIPINMASGKADKKKLPKSGHADVRTRGGIAAAGWVVCARLVFCKPCAREEGVLRPVLLGVVSFVVWLVLPETIVWTSTQTRWMNEVLQDKI